MLFEERVQKLTIEVPMQSFHIQMHSLFRPGVLVLLEITILDEMVRVLSVD
jgi:hypothetical protein